MCFCPSSCGHVFRQQLHAGIDTDNFTEAFNNVFHNHYQRLHYDRTIHSVVKLLANVVFPEQEQEYNIKTAMLTTHYRQPQHQLPEFLLGRPRQVQANCISNMEKAKEIKNDNIRLMVATKSNLTVVVHTQLIFVTVFAHAKVLFCDRYLANTCLRFFHNQIGAGMISPNLLPTVSI